MKTRCLILLALTTTIPICADGTTLLLQSEAIVSDQLVRLQDIAAMDTATLARIGDLIIARAPQPGKSEVFSRAEIRGKLRGRRLIDIELEGATAVRVIRKGSVCTPQMQGKLIRDYIKGHSPWGDDVEIEILNGRNLIVPENDFSWRIEATRSQDFLGTVLFSLKTISRGRESSAYWVSARLRVWREVAVSNRTLAKGEAIGSADYRWEKREITPFIRNALLNRESVNGLRTGRVVAANSVLTGDLLEKEWLVRRGEPASLQVAARNLAVTLRVIPLADGELGQRIRVSNENSRKIIYARVSGPNLLEVEQP